MTRVQAIVEEMRGVMSERYPSTGAWATRIIAAHRADLEEALAPFPNDWTIGCVDDCNATLASRRERYIP